MASHRVPDWDDKYYAHSDDAHIPPRHSSPAKDIVVPSGDHFNPSGNSLDLLKVDQDKDFAAFLPIETTSAAFYADYNPMGVYLEQESIKNTVFNFDNDTEFDSHAMAHEPLVGPRLNSPIVDRLPLIARNFQRIITGRSGLLSGAIPRKEPGDFTAFENFVAASQFGTIQLSIDGTELFPQDSDMTQNMGGDAIFPQNSHFTQDFTSMNERDPCRNTRPSAYNMFMNNPIDDSFHTSAKNSTDGSMAMISSYEEPWSTINPRYVVPRHISERPNAMSTHQGRGLSTDGGVNDNSNSHRAYNENPGIPFALPSEVVDKTASGSTVCVEEAQDTSERRRAKGFGRIMHNGPNMADPYFLQSERRSSIKPQRELGQGGYKGLITGSLSLLSPTNVEDSRILSVRISEDPNSEYELTSRCAICGVEFHGKHGKGNYSRHVRLKHRGPVPIVYNCEENSCNSIFNRQDARLKHYRKHHPHRVNRSTPPCRTSNAQTSSSSRASSLVENS